MTTHCRALFLKEEYKNKIYPPYMKYLLNNILFLHKVGEGSNKRLGITKISKISIELLAINVDKVKLKINNSLTSLLNCKINI